MGLALWLIPSSSSARLHIEEQIRSLNSPSLAPALSAPASAPFSAHATLIAGLAVQEGQDEGAIWTEAVEGVREWQSQQGADSKGIDCVLRDVTTRGIYFQCLLLALSLPSSLAQLNSIMRTRFNKQSQPPYFPHISLLYADIPAEEARGQIARLEQEGWLERVGLAAAGASGPDEEPSREGGGRERSVRVKDVGTAVSFNEVQLWECNGPVAGWKKLRSMSLVEER